MKIISISALALAVGFLVAPVRAQQPAPKAAGQTMPMAQAGGMMDHDKMMADMKAADARLEALAQTMKSAQGDAKIAAMQELVAVLVQNQIDMHQHMSMMHDMMMSQMPHK